MIDLKLKMAPFSEAGGKVEIEIIKFVIILYITFYKKTIFFNIKNRYIDRIFVD